MPQLNPEVIINALDKSLPCIFTRKECVNLLGGLFHAGTLANLQKDDPPYIKTKRHAVYEKASFLEWFAAYLAKQIHQHN